MFSGQNFRVKIEIQNSISEFARHYGMPVGGSATGSAGRRPAPPRPDRQPDRPAAGLGSAPAPPDRPPGRQAGASPEQGRQAPPAPV